MKKSTLFTLVLIMIMLSGQLLAQTRPGRIQGSVTAESGKGLEAATVSLLRAKDTLLIKVAVSDQSGTFEFDQLQEGNYLLRITAVGYRQVLHNGISITASKPVITIPSIQLSSAGQSLDEVTITAKKPLIENKIDRMVVNVEAAPTNAGATAMEVLEKSPGVSVNNDGVVSLRGKQGVIVMMDGKPTYLSPADLANLLKNMPASALDQIEIMTNPPAKYDASGNSGIINIKTKKSKTDGFNGSITLGGTLGFFKRQQDLFTPFKTSNSINLNYRKGKLNLFGNYTFNYREGKGELSLDRRLYEKNGSLNSISSSYTTFNFRNNNHTLKFGLDYYLDKKNVFGVVLNGFGFFGRPTPYNVQAITRPDDSVENVLESNTINQFDFFNYSGNFNYKHSFDSAGHELTVDLDYIGYSNHAKMLLGTNVYDDFGGHKVGSLVLKGDIPSSIDIFSIKADYTYPMPRDMRLDAGFKSSFVRNNNEVGYERQEMDGGVPVWKPDARSNHFIYQENINAAYASVNKKWKKWSGQFGLRLEQTTAKGNQVTLDSAFTRNYTNLFPTAYVNYEFNKDHSLTISYGRRIDRPNYQDLNPFIWFLDSLTYRQGNPYLMPQFTNNFELKHTFRSKYTATLNYTVTNDVITNLQEQNTAQRTTFSIPKNVAKLRNVGLAISAPLKPVSWWTANLSLNVFNNRFTGVYFNSYTGTNDPIDLEQTTYFINLSNTFTLPKSWSLEVSGFYNSKNIDWLTIGDPMYFLNIGAQKTIMKGKGTLRANFRDPFHWQKYSGHTLYSDIDMRIKNRWDNRSFTATFSYRFGKSTVAQARKRNSAANEEQNRAGGGQQ